MVQYCCVPGCRSNALIPGMRFHGFPKCPRLKRLWEIRIRRDTRLNKPISDCMRVCYEHFVESDYLETSKRKLYYLKKDAVPSVFPFNKPNSKPRRKLRPITSAGIPQENTSDANQRIRETNQVLPKQRNEGYQKVNRPIIQKISVVNQEKINVNQSHDEEHDEECLEDNITVPEENASVEIQENIDSYVINEDLCIDEFLKNHTVVSEKNASVEIQENIDSYIINEDLCIGEFLKNHIAVSEKDVGVEISEENDVNLINRNLCNKEYMEVNMPVSEENVSVQNEEENLDLVTEEQFNEKSLEVSMPSPEENVNVQTEEANLDLVTEEQLNKICLENVSVQYEDENLGLVTEEQFSEKSLEDTNGLEKKMLEERVKKLEEELAAVRSENSTLRCVVEELTKELLKYT